MIFHNGNIIFFHPGKTGGTSIEVALTKKYLDKDFPPVNPREVADYDLMYGYCRKHKLFLHHADVRFYQIVNKEIPEQYTKIVSVRRPYEKILSAYYYNGYDKKLTFKEFVETKLESLINLNKTFAKNHFCPQTHYYREGFYIVKLENIHNDCLKVDIQISDRQHCKTKASENYENYMNAYDKQTLQTVNELYKEDFRTFNYELQY
jgi:hypothetical protein